MRKFKIFFYPIYVIVTLLVLYFSIDMLANMEAYKSKITFNMLRDIPTYLLSLFIFLCLIMITEIVVENTHIISLKNKLTRVEKEVLNLKAKLYDRSQSEEPQQPEDSPEEGQEEDDYN